MPFVTTREFAIAAVEAEIARLESEPCDFDEMHVVCAIEAIRRGDHDAAVNHISLMRCETIPREVRSRPPSRPLLCREKLRAMLAELADRDMTTRITGQVWSDAAPEPPKPPPAPPPGHLATRS